MLSLQHPSVLLGWVMIFRTSGESEWVWSADIQAEIMAWMLKRVAGNVIQNDSLRMWLSCNNNVSDFVHYGFKSRLSGFYSNPSNFRVIGSKYENILTNRVGYGNSVTRCIYRLWFKVKSENNSHEKTLYVAVFKFVSFRISFVITQTNVVYSVAIITALTT